MVDNKIIIDKCQFFGINLVLLEFNKKKEIEMINLKHNTKITITIF